DWRRRLLNLLWQRSAGGDDKEMPRVGRRGDKPAKRVCLPHHFLCARGPTRLSIETQLCKSQVGNAERRLGTLPSHGIFSHKVDVIRKDFAPAEGTHECLAKTPFVIPLDIAVGGDQRPKVFAELHVRRRAIIHGANADVKKLPGDFTRLLRDSLDQWLG